jgi:hypothetical protein
VLLTVQNNFLVITTVAQMIDNEVDFSNILDAPEEAQPAAKFSIKPCVMPRKATLKSSVPNPAAVIKDVKAGAVKESASTIGAVIQNERSDTGQIGIIDDHVQAPTCHESGGHTSNSEALMGGNNITIAYV